MIRLHVLLGSVAAAGLAAGASAQSFNVDLDVNIDPGFGGGPPSSAFGAAAGQSGFWNAIDDTTGPFALNDLSNQATGVTIAASADAAFSFGSVGNLGGASADAILLLADVADPGTGTTWTFDGLANGLYDVYTYAMAPDNSNYISQVTVNGANPQDVGGAYGGSFVAGTTHALHSATVDDGTLAITVGASPNGPSTNFGSVAGFQIVLVPAPAALPMLGVGMLVGGRRRRRRRR